MAKFLRLGTSFQSLVRKTIANNDGDLYLELDIAFTDPSPMNFYFDFAQFNDGVSFAATTMFALAWTGTDWEDFEDSGLTSPVNPPSPLTWQTILLRWRRGTAGGGYTDGITEVTVDGTLLWSDFDYYDEPTNQITFENDSGDVIYVDNIKLGTTPGGTEIWSEDFEGLDPLSNFDFVHNDARIVSAFDPPPVTPKVGPASYEWRFAVTKLNSGRVLALLDGIATQRKVTKTLNKAAVATGVVPADNPTVNLVQSDGFPILDEGVRALIGFRRESVNFAPKWFARFAGIIMQVEDNVDENGGVAPYTTFTAYDPWQLLYKRPVRTASGALPGPNGVTFTGEHGNDIVEALLDRTFTADGNHYIGLFGAEVTDVISKITFQQGLSVGEALDQIVATGNCDIVFDTDYIPHIRPGSLASVTVYKLAGYNYDGTPDTKHKAPLAWDRPRRNVVGLNRLKDGTQRANRVQYYSGPGGPPVGEVSDFSSVFQYGDYWSQQFFPGANPAAVELLAEEQVVLKSKGSRTYKVNVAPQALGQISSPIFGIDYDIGTILPLYASRRFRHEIAVGKRVISIPIVIADNGVETIEQLEFDEGEIEIS